MGDRTASEEPSGKQQRKNTEDSSGGPGLGTSGPRAALGL